MDTKLHTLYRALSKAQQHPVMGKHVEWVNLDFILRIANPEPKSHTDLGNWSAGAESPLVNYDALLADILARGMRDPLILGIGSRTSMMRLETGNQRVRALAQAGVQSVPVVGLYSEYQVTNSGNGSHQGEAVTLLKPAFHELLGPYQERRYCKVSTEVAHLLLRCSAIPEYREMK